MVRQSDGVLAKTVLRPENPVLHLFEALQAASTKTKLLKARFPHSKAEINSPRVVTRVTVQNHIQIPM